MEIFFPRGGNIVEIFEVTRSDDYCRISVLWKLKNRNDQCDILREDRCLREYYLSYYIGNVESDMYLANVWSAQWFYGICLSNAWISIILPIESGHTMGGMSLIDGITVDNNYLNALAFENFITSLMRKISNASAIIERGHLDPFFFFLFPFRRRIEIAVRELFRPICMNRIYMKSLSRFIFRVTMEEITGDASIIILQNYRSPWCNTSPVERWEGTEFARILFRRYSRNKSFFPNEKIAYPLST